MNDGSHISHIFIWYLLDHEPFSSLSQVIFPHWFSVSVTPQRMISKGSTFAIAKPSGCERFIIRQGEISDKNKKERKKEREKERKSSLYKNGWSSLQNILRKLITILIYCVGDVSPGGLALLTLTRSGGSCPFEGHFNSLRGDRSSD